MDRYAINQVRQRYDMRKLYPVSPARRHGSRYDADVCIYHDDQKPSMLIFADGYYCMACGARGDVFRLLMETEHLNFTDAFKLAADDVGMHLQQAVYAGPPAENRPVAVYQPEEIDPYLGQMDYAAFKTLTGIGRETAESHLVGRLGEGLFTIPILDPEGVLVDCKVYRPGAPKGEIKMWHLKNDARKTLYGYPYLNGDGYAVIIGGEKDAIRGHEDGLPFLTSTGGENSWDPAWNRILDSKKKVYSFLDADMTGRMGTEKIRRAMRRVVPCDWRLLWSRSVKKGYDYSDFRNEGNKIEWFLRMLRMAEKGLTGHTPLRDQLIQKGELDAERCGV